MGKSGAVAPGTSELAWVRACALGVITRDMVQSVCFWQRVYTVTRGSDPRGTRNADSDGRLKRSRTSEDKSERRGIEAGVRLDVDKHAGGP